MSEKSGSYNKYCMLGAIMLGVVMLTFDISMVIFSLPSIATGLNVSITSTGFLLILFNIFGYCFMVIFGRLGDLLGRRRLFLYGCGTYVVCAILAGLAPRYDILIAVRILQGIAAAMIGANYPALITLSFPDKERGRAFGIAKTVTALAAILAPIISGEIIMAIGWRYIFFFCAPFGVASIILCLRLLPESRGSLGGPIDHRGAILIFAVFFPLSIALTQGGTMGWIHPSIIGLFAVAVLACCLFQKHIRRVEYPLVDLTLFRIPNFALSNFAGFFRAISHQMFYYVTPFFLMYYMRMSPLRAGLVMSIGAAAAMLVLFLSGTISDRVGCAPLELTGMALTAGVFGLLAMGSAGLNLEEVIIGLILVGLGFGIFNAPNHSAVMGSVPRERLGTAGGTYETFRVMGYFIAIPLADVVMGKWAVKSQAMKTSIAAAGNPEFLLVVHHDYLAGLIVVILGLVTCVLKFRYRSRPGF